MTTFEDLQMFICGFPALQNLSLISLDWQMSSPSSYPFPSQVNIRCLNLRLNFRTDMKPGVVGWIASRNPRVKINNLLLSNPALASPEVSLLLDGSGPTIRHLEVGGSFSPDPGTCVRPLSSVLYAYFRSCREARWPHVYSKMHRSHISVS